MIYANDFVDFESPKSSARLDFWWFPCGRKLEAGGNKDVFHLTCACWSWLFGLLSGGCFLVHPFGLWHRQNFKESSSKIEPQPTTWKTQAKLQSPFFTALWWHPGSTQCHSFNVQMIFGITEIIPNQDLIQINGILIFGMHPFKSRTEKFSG